MATPWRKLYTQMLDNHFLMADDTAFLVFVKLILFANDSGEFQVSGRELAQIINVKYTTLYKTLARLEDQHMIKMIATPRGRQSIIKILNWQKYQTKTTPVGKQISKQMSMQPEQGRISATVSTPVSREVGSRYAAGKQPVSSGALSNRSNTTHQNKNKNKIAAASSAEAAEILKFYNQTFQSNLRPLPARMAKIDERLAIFGSDDFKQAIRNAKDEPFFNGTNATGFRGDIDWLMKTEEQLEKYVNMQPAKRNYF
jgi:hypothetical protein